MIKKVFGNILEVIGCPIYRHSIFAFFFFFLLVVPSLFYYYDSLVESNTLWRIFRLSCPELFATFVLLCIIECLFKIFNVAIYRTCVAIIHLIVYLLSFVNVFLVESFSCLVNPYVFFLIKQSDLDEMSDFISTYVLNGNFLFLLLSYIAVFAFECCLLFYRKRIRSGIESFLKMVSCVKYVFPAMILLLFCLAFIQLDTFVFCMLPGSFSALPGVYENLIVRNIQSISQYTSDKKIFSNCANSQRDISIDSCNMVNSDIVLVIGESHSKYHSSLYGYHKETNPRLKEENIFVFDNVISCVNYTFMSFREFMSFSSMDGDFKWYECPLFPCAFKQIGYNVIFESNQFVKEPNMQTVDASCAFFFHPEIESKMIDYRNQNKYKLDEELIDSYKALRDSIEKKERPNLIIFHLNGQHFDAKNKYPLCRSFFEKADYASRNELSSIEKEYVANYDNATLYNDSIVSEIIKMYKNKDAILLYFSDHGEEVFDYRSHIGRTAYLYRTGASALHCQLDIPFFIYTTEKYKENHRDNVERIRMSTHRPFMIDDLPHLLFDLAGVRSVWYSPQRSVINDSFNIHRKRLVFDYGCDTPYDYDSICSSYGSWKLDWQ